MTVPRMIGALWLSAEGNIALQAMASDPPSDMLEGKLGSILIIFCSYFALRALSNVTGPVSGARKKGPLICKHVAIRKTLNWNGRFAYYRLDPSSHTTANGT